ncbi:MAG TPA: hypothetical protein VMB27_09040 [Solirubrobacteraceae bacterium]|nr:hypothetical protein [Solirubrobacteraceae bacterium]
MQDDAQAAGPVTAAGSDTDRNESVVTRLMRAGTGEVDALLEALGMREQLSGEAQDIARLIERRLAEVAWGDHAHALDQLEIQRAFLAHRFIGPMKTYERMNRGYAVLDNFLNLTSILAGIGASLAAALDAPKAWAISFGLVVGFLQSISQWLKPSQRSTRRGLAAADLRSEAWAFLQRRDRYRGKDDLTAWTLLCDQVDRVEDREQSEQDKEAAQVRPSPATVHR